MTLVTDLDAGAETGEGVSHDGGPEGVRARTSDRLREVLFDAVAALPPTEARDCLCTHAHDGWDLGIELP